MKNLVILALLLLAVVSSSHAVSPPVALASLDVGHVLKEADSRVTRYRYLLNSLDSKYTESTSRIGDMTVTAQEQLKDHYGLSSSLKTILEDTNIIIRSIKNPKPSFAEWVAAYVVLVGGGQNHSEAALDLQALAQTLGY